MHSYTNRTPNTHNMHTPFRTIIKVSILAVEVVAVEVVGMVVVVVVVVSLPEESLPQQQGLGEVHPAGKEVSSNECTLLLEFAGTSAVEKAVETVAAAGMEGRRRRMWRRYGLRQNLRPSSVLIEQMEALLRKPDDQSVVILKEGEVLLRIMLLGEEGLVTKTSDEQVFLLPALVGWWQGL